MCRPRTIAARGEAVQGLQREHELLQEEHALLKTHSVHLRTKADAFAFTEEERGRFGRDAAVSDVGRDASGYYAWRQRPVSASKAGPGVIGEMRAIFEDSDGTYGSPRIHESLAGRGHRVNRRRVERLMRARRHAGARVAPSIGPGSPL
jgi:helix-turn-helix protein